MDSSGMAYLENMEPGVYTVTEIAAPQGYLLDDTPQIVKLEAGKTSNITLKNRKRPGIIIKKYDEMTATVLKGAEFSVAKKSGSVIYEGVTDENGMIQLTDLEEGWYTITELTAPEGYIITTKSKDVYLEAGKTVEVKFDNRLKPSLNIIKLDSQTNQPIAGAVFEVRKSGSSSGTEYVTDADGSITIHDLDEAVYIVKEVEAPAGYLNEHEQKETELKWGTMQTLVFTNKAEPSLSILKLDEETKEPLAGAKFRISETEGITIGEYVTDINGRILVKGLKDIIYTVEEISAPEGYLLETQHKDVKLEWGKTTSLVFTNKTKPALEILKLDEETKKPLAGAKFRVTATDGSMVGEYATGADGRILIRGLEEKTYSIEEISAPDGYLLETQHKDISLEWRKTKSIIFTNKAKPALEIIKLDEETRKPLAGAKFRVTATESSTVSEYVTDADGRILITGLEAEIYSIEEIAAPDGYLLEVQHKDIRLEWGKTKSVIFTNKAKPSLEIKKIDAVTGQPLAGAKFKVSLTENLTVGEYITDTDGVVLIKNLEEAIYTVEEIVPPDGYILDAQKKEIKLEWGKKKTLVYEDIRKPALIITKSNALTYEPIPDTTYKLEYEDANGGVRTIGTYRTDLNGQITLPKSEPGWYIITEIAAAPGYSLAANPVTRKYLAPGENAYTNTNISGTGDTSGINIMALSGSDFLIGHEILDYPLNSIIIRKVNAVTGELLAGARFQVRKVTGETTGSSGTIIGEYTTDSSGVIVLTGLESGGYIVEEVKAPTNYLLSENSQQQVWLKYDGTSIVETTFANAPYGSILVTKTDAKTGKPLANARFRVTDGSGAVAGNTNGEFITDENGEILIPNMKPGSYVVTEIEAPSNYVIDTTPQTVNVGTDGKIYKIGFKNQPYAGILVTKTDTQTGKPLANARFKITDSAGAVVGTSNGIFVSDENGEFLVPNVKPGSYVITEIEAPEYYAIDTTPQTVYVAADGEIYRVGFKNQPTGTLVIRKLDTASKEPLADAQFKVTTSGGDAVGTSNGIFKTDAAGTITIPHLEKGSYIVQEIKAPDGYILENQSQTIVVDYGKSYTLDFYNKKMSGLQIIKIDSQTKQPLKGAEFTVYKQNGEIVDRYSTDADGVIIIDTLSPGWYKVVETKTLDGYVLDETPKDVEITSNQFVKVVFENAPMSSLIIRKVDADTREPLEGAEFTVKMASGTLIGIYRSSTDGTVSVPQIAPGWYTVTETKAPDGYTLGDNVQTVEITNTKTVTLEFQNRAFGSLVIKKLDEITGSPLAGAEFSVYKQGGAFVGEYTTGKDGTISISSVEPGWYVISEIKAPLNYTLDSTAKIVEVKPVVPTVATFTNKPLSGIEIIKTDSVTHNPLAGATFVVERANGEKIGTYKTDVSGKVIVSGLTEGTYIISETIAPDGYHLNETPKTVIVTSGKLTTVEFSNRPYSGIEIIKTDAVTNNPLSGATFVVERPNGERIGMYKTDVAGKIIVPDLTEGTYIVSETIAPDGYHINETPKTVIVTSGKLTTVEFSNRPYSGIEIIKSDSVTHNPLSGARFTIERPSGERIGTYYITDASGKILVPDLQEGVYIVSEVTAPSGYTLNETPKTVTVVSGRLTVVEFVNDPYGSLVIKKMDEITEQPLSGARFTVRHQDGSIIGEDYTTGTDGSITIPNLKQGWYVISETKAPNGYQLDSTAKTIEVKPYNPTVITFTNRPHSGIEIIKLDSVTKLPLVDAVFEVSNVKGDKIGTYKTDVSGKALVAGLPEGAYIVSEIQAPDGYMLYEIPKTINVISERITTVEFMNKPYSGIQIIKTDALTDAPLKGAVFTVQKPNGDKIGDKYTTDIAGKIIVPDLPEGVYIITEIQAPNEYILDALPKTVEVKSGRLIVAEFTNTPYPYLHIVKTDASTGRLLSGAEFVVTNSKSEVIASMVSQAGGAVSIKVEPGIYTITEVKAPEGYELNDPVQTVEVLADGRTVYYGTNTVYQGNTASFANRPLNSLQIVKLDSVTHNPLSNAIFKVEKATGESIGTFRTGLDGSILISGLTEGTYIISEISAPAGYILSKSPKSVNLSGGRLVDVMFFNKPLSAIQITKLDAVTGKPLQGAAFTVSKADGERIGTFRTEADGKVLISGLDEGVYTIGEIQAPDGYIINEVPKNVTVVSGKLAVVEFVNKPYSGIEITKIDAVTKAPLQGATFEVIRADGTKIGSYKTDTAGKILVSNLSEGTYIVSETIAPSGYMLDNTPKTVNVVSDRLASVEFSNAPYGSLVIKKTDEITGSPLAGAGFIVKHQNSSLVGDFVTGNDGSVVIPDLEQGWYVISETKAPSGYILDSTAKTIEVKTYNPTVVTFTNKPLSGIEIIKLDAQTKAPLSGAAFVVERDNGEKIGTFKTDSTGKIIVSNLTEGTYIISETIAPDNYILDEAPKTVIVKSGILTTVEFFNKPLAGLKIIKLNSVTRNPIAGVEFEISKLSGEKIENDFRGYTFKTDKTGQIYIPNLKDGYYTVTEKRTAEGYILDGEPKTVLIHSGKITVLEVLNKPMSGLLIIKTDELTGKPLAGVVYDIKKADGSLVTGSILDGNQPNTANNSPNKTTSPNGDISGSYTTDSNGRIQINGLEAGQYTVTERKSLNGYELDAAVYNVTVVPGKVATLQLTNKPYGGIRLTKIDSVSKKPINGVEFMLFDADNKVVGVYYTDNNGVIDFPSNIPEGRYTIRETKAAAGYCLDDVPKTVEFVSGKVTEITWTNTPQMGQIQIIKKSGDNNEMNGLPAGTLLSGAVFEVYNYKTGNLVDRFVSSGDGIAVSSPLPLGRYIVKEVQAPQYYKLSNKELDLEIEAVGQIVKREFLNYSANTGVNIKKTGNVEAMPGDLIRYNIKAIQNTGTVPLSDFYWRDVLPIDPVRLNKIVTGTYNQSLKYKIIATTNKGDTKIISDNLSTTKNNIIDCSNASLGLKKDEFITSFTLVFGTVKAGFAQVETPQIYVNVLKNLSNGYKFANKCDVGGKYGVEWIIGNSTCLTTIYNKSSKLPKTGY